jgi:predicted nuclease of predicted toxin-antitoxin system
MRIMLDECVPVRLKRWLSEHEVQTVTGAGWSGIKNGRLLKLLVDGGYEVLVTADKNLEHQQGLRELPLAILVLPTNHWKSLLPQQSAVLRAFASLRPGKATRVN